MKQRSLVIEDYYCVAVQGPETSDEEAVQSEGAVESEDRLGEDYADASRHRVASIFSEEAPAHWLSAPDPVMDRSESLSMETVGDTSESEGERQTRALSCWSKVRTGSVLTIAVALVMMVNACLVWSACNYCG